MKIADKNTKAVDLVREALAKAKQFEGYHCFISMNEARALEKAREIDEKIAKGEAMASTPAPAGKATDGSKTITREQFDKMSYSERAELFDSNPDLYKELSK